jgi:hypothetical protein
MRIRIRLIVALMIVAILFPLYVFLRKAICYQSGPAPSGEESSGMSGL